MNTKLATVGNRSLGRMEDACVISDGSMVPLTFGDKQQSGGMQFDCGYLSPYFITDPEHMEVVFENVYILICEGEIGSMKDLLPLLNQITKGNKPLLIIAEEVGSEALATLVVSKLRGTLQVAAVRAPGFGNQRKKMLQDIALLTGGKTVSENVDIQLRSLQLSDLGQAKKVIIGKKNTVIENGVKYDALLFEPAACIRPSPTVACPMLAD